MAFFDRFLKTVGDGFWDFEGNQITEGFGGAWRGVQNLFRSDEHVERQLAAEGNEDPSHWDRVQRRFMGAGEALGGTVEGLTGVPVLRSAIAVLDDVYDGAVRRPIASYGLMTGDAINKADAGISVDHMLNWEAWKDAYNTTTYVTPGQALTFSALSNIHGLHDLFGFDNLVDLDELTELEEARFFEAYPNLGLALQDNPGKFDPRMRGEDGRRAYYQNNLLKNTSGSLDLAVLLVADPFLVAGPVTRSVYISRVKRPLDAAALAAGKLEGHVKSDQYRKLKEFIAAEAARDGGTSEVVARRAFANHSHGDLAAAILFDAAKRQKRFNDLGGTIDLYDTTFRALYGDQAAWRTLTTQAQSIADDIGQAKASLQVANAARMQGMGDPKVDARVANVVGAKTRAWLDDIVMRNGKWGLLEDGKVSLIDSKRAPVGAPRLTWTSAWRTGVHNWMRNKPRAALGHWARRTTMALPSQRSGRMLDLHDSSSVGVFRSIFSMSRLSQRDLDELVSKYANASNPAERFEVYLKAEDRAVRDVGAQYGIDQDALENMLPVINRFRRGNRQLLSHNRLFASSMVRREADRAIADGRPSKSENLRDLSDDVQRAVDRGEMPEAFYQYLDENGILTLIPEDTSLALNRPLLRTQHADIVPVIDFNVLENALWWHLGRGGNGSIMRRKLGGSMHGAIDMTRAMLDVANTVWKASAILRPGYIMRTLSDELLRMYAVLGSSTIWGTIGRSPRNMAANAWSRKRLMGEAMEDQRARRLAGSEKAIRVDAELIATGKSLDTPADKYRRERPFEAQDLQGKNLSEAFADGTLTMDDFVAMFKNQGSAGVLDDNLMALYTGVRDGQLSEKKFRKQLMFWTLREQGRGAFTSPTWQQFFIDHVADRGRPGPKGDPRPQLIDPFTGNSPDITPARARGEFEPVGGRMIFGDQDGNFRIDDVFDYIFDHFDHLQNPNALLGATVTGEGTRIELAVYRGKVPDTPLKSTAGQRVKLPKWITERRGELYKDSGTADFDVHTAAGPVRLHGAFAGGDGDRLRKQTRSRGPRDSVIDALVDLEYERLNVMSHRWQDVSPTQWEAYRGAWDRAVNVQLRGDPVAKKFMEGHSIDEVTRWLFNTKDGRQYQREMGNLWRSHYSDNIAQVQVMVDTYLPVVEGRLHESRLLRAKAARGEATVADMERVVPRHRMPQVHGAALEGTLHKGPIADKFKKAMDGVWHWISSVPHDKFVRHPFAAQRYKMHAEELAQARGVFKARDNQRFTLDELRSIEADARQRALRDVNTFMFFNNAGLDLARSARFLSPFGSALTDSLLKHGVAARSRPERYWQTYKIWSAPDRAGLITDADGNELRIEDGEEVWYAENPATGEMERVEPDGDRGRYITFRLPSWMAPDSYGEGTRPITRINKLVFQTAFGLPTFGPLVAVPANELSLNNPEFSEKEWFNRFVLPFGTMEHSAEHLVPANVRNQYRRFVKEDEDLTNGQITSIFASDMADYSLGLREQPPTFAEARQKAADLQHLRWLWAFMGVSPQFQSPYQPYVDYYSQLRLQEFELREQAQAEGRDLGEIDSADERFYREMGDEYFSLVARTTRNTAGIPATIEADKAWRKYQDMMERHPDIAGLIMGSEGAGEFNYSVYQNQKRNLLREGSSDRLREVVPPDEAWEDVERRRGWIEFGKLNDMIHVHMNRMGVTSLNETRAEPLRMVRDAWLQSKMFTESPWGERTVNPWFEDYRTVDTSRMIKRLHSMREIVQDRRLQGRDDIRGLIEYLTLRDSMKSQMELRGFGTLGSDEAAPMKREWLRVVHMLKDENLAFASLYDRWLHADEDLEA